MTHASYAFGTSSRRARANHTLMVRSLTRKGAVTKMKVSPSDWQFNAFSDMSKARSRAESLVEMNPGTRYAIVAVDGSWVGSEPLEIIG